MTKPLLQGLIGTRKAGNMTSPLKVGFKAQRHSACWTEFRPHQTWKVCPCIARSGRHGLRHWIRPAHHPPHPSL